jgi:tRNA(Ile)-lysidine synthase
MNQRKTDGELLLNMQAYIRSQELITSGTPVLAGVSGGADSMCLLSLLMEYQGAADFPLRVIHVEHGIRGADSIADASCVEEFCRAHGLCCEVVSVDAAGFAKERGLSLEEAARELRYQAFSRCADDWQKQLGADAQRVRIAVAHHREDQAETILWQMIRGSDIRGLGGMRPRRGQIIRPLLFAGRDDIEAYLNAHGISWREDATNREEAYTRNRLRHAVLPVLTGLNDQAVAHLCETGERLRETEDYLARETDEKMAVHTRAASDGIRISDSLLTEHPLMIRRVLYGCVERLVPGAKDITSRHIALLRELFSHQVGARIRLPYGIVAERAYEGIAVSRGQEPDMCRKKLEISEKQFSMEILTELTMAEISKKKYTKWFDYDKIKNNVQIRERQQGDYLVIDREGHRQSLRRYLMNEKIPAAMRDALPLVADGSHIMWVVGYRISDYYKVDEHTKRVLKVQLIGGKEDE